MRRPEIWELVEEILVRPDLVSRHLAIRKHGEENIDNVVRKSPTILWKGRRAASVIGKDVGQQLPGFNDRIPSRIASRVLQRTVRRV